MANADSAVWPCLFAFAADSAQFSPADSRLNSHPRGPPSSAPFLVAAAAAAVCVKNECGLGLWLPRLRVPAAANSAGHFSRRDRSSRRAVASAERTPCIRNIPGHVRHARVPAGNHQSDRPSTPPANPLGCCTASCHCKLSNTDTHFVSHHCLSSLCV